MPTARPAGTPAPAFLPLAVDAARTVATGIPEQATAQVVRRHAETADAVAAECWTALLAGCQTPARRALPARLRELTEATSAFLGARYWFNASSPHRDRVTGAEARIAEAVVDGDGAEFAEAFAGYDQAVATAVVSVPALARRGGMA